MTAIASKKWTKEEVRFKLDTDDRWLYRGLLAIYAHQTEDEKQSELTKHDNGIGFNGVDSNFLSRAARLYTEAKFLTKKHKECVRKKMLKYASQLARIANGELK